MVAFTYIAKRSSGKWSAARIGSEEGPELTAESSDTFSLQKELRDISVENSAGGSVQTLLTQINKDTLIFQVNVGGAVASGGGGGAAAASGGAAAAAEEKKEEKKEDSEEEEDEDMGFSLFD